MDYAYDLENKLGKTYTIPAKFTALNGTIQYYKLTAGVDLVAEGEGAAEAQANLLRVLEVLRTYGGQPVITKAEGKVVEFTLEQANVYGKDAEAAADKIEEIFGEAKAVDGATKLFSAVEVKEAF